MIDLFQFQKVQFRVALPSAAPNPDRRLSIPEGPIQRAADAHLQLLKDDFQFQKVQFRVPLPASGARISQLSIPEGPIQRWNPYGDGRPRRTLSIPEGPIQRASITSSTLSSSTFNSRRSNSEGRPRRYLHHAKRLSIPEGPIQSVSTDDEGAPDADFQFQKVQFRERRQPHSFADTGTFNSRRSNSE